MESEYAKEGTLAHDYAAKILQGILFPKGSIPEEMLKSISVYIDYVIGLYKQEPEGRYYVEKD